MYLIIIFFSVICYVSCNLFCRDDEVSISSESSDDDVQFISTSFDPTKVRFLVRMSFLRGMSSFRGILDFRDIWLLGRELRYQPPYIISHVVFPEPRKVLKWQVLLYLSPSPPAYCLISRLLLKLSVLQTSLVISRLFFQTAGGIKIAFVPVSSIILPYLFWLTRTCLWITSSFPIWSINIRSD